MAVTPIPAPLDQLEQRPFSFYPPIVNIEHNEWMLRRSTWSELLVANTKDQNEIWMPRRFLGEISAIDEPVLIVGLTRELEYRAGQLVPHVQRVLSMPAVRAPELKPAGTTQPEPPKRDVTPAEFRVGRLIALVLATGVIACALLIVYFRSSRDGSRVAYRGVVQTDLGLNAEDDYNAVVRKLGRPAGDRWRSNPGELQYRLLEYPDRGIYIVLMGPERDRVRYIGALDREWQVTHSVGQRGADTVGLLRSLKRF